VVTHALSAEGVSKRYGDTLALDGVTVALSPGEIHGLVGHNGAGKSTLLRLLAGAERPDAGSLILDGKPVSLSGPGDAISRGISCVYQELSLVEDATVYENIFLGREMMAGGHLAKRRMRRVAAEFCREFELSVSPDDRVRSLPVAQRQLVEVIAATHRDARFLLLDEPTTALAARQIEQFLETVRRLAHQRGLAILLVDHKLDEIFAVADRVTALANGRVVLTGTTNEVGREQVMDAIVGHSTAATGATPRGRSTAAVPGTEPVLRVAHLHTDRLADVTLSVRAGEVIGIYGLVGSGRTRFLRTLYGTERIVSGSIQLEGRPFRPRSPAAAIRRGVAYVTEERKADGFVPRLTGLENVVLPVFGRYRRHGVLRRRQLSSTARRVAEEMNVHGRLDAPMSGLSGGNQQKLLIGRAVLQQPRLLLLDEPTKGVDIGAKAEIHALIRKIAAESGVAVIVVSSEEEELLELADSIAVFVEGRCDGTANPSGAVTAGELRSLAWAQVASTAA
jgi:ribose transport system ATP-binding protein